MGIVFMDGFAHYSVDQAGRTWSVVTNSANIAIGTTYGRGDGKSGVQIGANSSLLLSLTTASSAYVVVGFAFYLNSLPTSGSWVLCSVSNSTGMKQNLRVDSNGVVSICSGSGTTAYTGCTSNWIIGSGIWHYCEYKVTSSGSTALGDCGVQMNGVQYITMPAGINTSAFGDINWITIGHGSGSGSSYGVKFADVIVSDSGGYVGDRVVHTLLPIDDGSRLDFSVTGAANAYAAVNETSPNLDTSYISASTVGNTQSFVMSSPSVTLYSISGVQIIACAELDAGSTPRYSCGAVVSGTVYNLSSRNPTNTYSYLFSSNGSSIAFGANPSTSSPWVDSDLAALEASVQLV